MKSLTIQYSLINNKESAFCEDLGNFIERLNCNFFYNEKYFDQTISYRELVHYPNKKWFALQANNTLPQSILDDYCLEVCNPKDEWIGFHLLILIQAYLKN